MILRNRYGQIGQGGHKFFWHYSHGGYRLFQRYSPSHCHGLINKQAAIWLLQINQFKLLHCPWSCTRFPAVQTGDKGTDSSNFTVNYSSPRIKTPIWLLISINSSYQMTLLHCHDQYGIRIILHTNMDRQGRVMGTGSSNITQSLPSMD